MLSVVAWLLIIEGLSIHIANGATNPANPDPASLFQTSLMKPPLAPSMKIFSLPDSSTLSDNSSGLYTMDFAANNATNKQSPFKEANPSNPTLVNFDSNSFCANTTVVDGATYCVPGVHQTCSGDGNTPLFTDCPSQGAESIDNCKEQDPDFDREKKKCVLSKNTFCRRSVKDKVWRCASEQQLDYEDNLSSMGNRLADGIIVKMTILVGLFLSYT